MQDEHMHPGGAWFIRSLHPASWILDLQVNYPTERVRNAAL